MRRSETRAVGVTSKGALLGIAGLALFSLAACSGHFEDVGGGASGPPKDGGPEAAGECSAIQGCATAPPADGAVAATDASSTPPSPPTPPVPSSDASSPTNPPGCPTAPPPAGDICHVAGVACTWKDACSTTSCSCEALGNGPASWQCAGTNTCFDAGH